MHAEIYFLASHSNIVYNLWHSTLAAPLDYQTVQQQLTFTSQSMRIPIPIPIQSDQIDEDDETFRVLLERVPPSSTVSLDPESAVVTISDDDGT